MSETLKLPNGADFLLRFSFSDGEANGIIVLIVISALSMVAVVGLLAGIAVSAYNTRASEDKHLFVKTHVAAYFICFLLSDFLQAVGTLMSSTWVRDNAVVFGETCTAQGVIKEMADVSSAIWTMVIAIHTFFLLVLEVKLRTFILWTTLFGGWSAIFAIVISGPALRQSAEKGPFYAISGYWCWISPNYQSDRFTRDYLLMFMAALVAFILYGLVYLKLRGNLVTSGYRLRFVKISVDELAYWRQRRSSDENLKLAMRMWIYPMAYVILIFPMSVVRFVEWGGHNVPFAATIFTDSIFLLIGVVNVTLFLTTRPVLPPKTMWSISAPTLVKTEEHEVPRNSRYRSAHDPYYRSFFFARQEEAKEDEQDPEAQHRFHHEHDHHDEYHDHRHSQSQYSQHSAHSEQHRSAFLAMPPLAYRSGGDRDYRRYSCSDCENGNPCPQGCYGGTRHDSIPARNHYGR